MIHLITHPEFLYFFVKRQAMLDIHSSSSTYSSSIIFGFISVTAFQERVT